MILSPYPPISLSPHLSLLSPHSDGDIWTDFPADRTPCALLICIPNHVKISLAINLFPNLHQGFRAGNRTEPTSLATFLVNLDFSHDLSKIKGSRILGFEGSRVYLKKVFTGTLGPLPAGPGPDRGRGRQAWSLESYSLNCFHFLEMFNLFF